MSPPDLKTTLEEIAHEAGALIMDIFNRPDSGVEYKLDCSPVTIADREAEHLITQALQSHYNDIPIIGEEAVSSGHFPKITGNSYFLVDAVDGTKGFIKKRPDFTVNIALIETGKPSCGIIHAPVHQETWIAHEGRVEKIYLKHAQECTRMPVCIRHAAHGPEIALISHTHSSKKAKAYLEQFNITEKIAVGSSLKFCLIAQGDADIYPRFGRTMQWDTAAGQAILEAAGGRVITEDGAPLLYGKDKYNSYADFSNPSFIADNQI
ncbi:MAG: 3'(2'),5'-bisphosphate nucleotidase CysQ [Alphaproteobacteria bacterium]